MSIDDPDSPLPFPGQPPAGRSRTHRLERWFPLLILAAGVLAYANSFGVPFIFDDTQLITANLRIHTLWPPWRAISVPTRFLADLSFALNHAVGGFTPADFHVTNLVIHLLAGLLLYGTLRRTFLLPRMAPRFGSAAAPLAAAIAAGWVAHPLQTESVTYIVQRVESLMGCVYLAVLYCTVRALSPGGHPAWKAAACGACLLGMGTKEVMITAPFLVVAYDGLFVASSWTEVWRSRGRFHLCLFLTLLFFFCLLRLSVLQAAATGGLFYGGISRWAYLLTQFQAIPHYLRLVFVPWPLCLDYKWPLVKDLTQVLPAVLMLVPAGILILWGVWKRRPVAFLPFAFFVILAPTSSVIPLPDTVFEHRMYLPLAAVLGSVVAGGYALVQRLRGGRTASGRAVGLAVSLGVLIVIAFALMTRQRNRDYASEETLWRAVLKTRPDNHRAYISLSTSLVGQGRAEEAAAICRDLLGRLPDFSGMSFPEIEQQWNRDRSVPCATYAMAHNNLGAALLLNNRIDEAKAHFTEAIRVLPRATWARMNLAKTLFLENRLDDAIAELQTVLRLDSHDPQIHSFLGMAYVAKGQYAPAADRYREALRLSPEDGSVRTQFAWMLATCPDETVRNGIEAVDVAKPLIQLSQQKSARAFDVLGAAYAEAREFDLAIEMAGRALALARDEKAAAHESPTAPARTTGKDGGLPGSSEFENAVRARLELYRKRTPFRVHKPAGGRM